VSIGEYAFYNDTGIVQVDLGRSVEKIKEYAFHHCSSLSSITFPAFLDSIGSNAFSECYKLQSIVIPGLVTSIGSYAFSACTGLKSVAYLGKKDPGIGTLDPFYRCEQLTQLCVPTNYISSSFCGFEDLAPLAECGVAPIATGICGEGTTWYLDMDSGVLTVKGNGPMKDVCNLTNNQKGYVASVVIADGVTSIVNGAFYNYQNLETLTISSSFVGGISYQAFKSCVKLKTLTIPNSVPWIGESAFSGCSSLESVTIGDSVVRINKGAFTNCENLKQVIFGKSVKTIYEDAFYGCISLSSIILPDSLTDMASNSFYGCTSLESVAYLGDKNPAYIAFTYCPKVKNVCVPSYYSSDTFGGKDITSLDKCGVSPIRSGLCGKGTVWQLDTNTGALTVKGNTDMKEACDLTTVEANHASSLVIGDGVKSIAPNAFKDGVNLKSVTIPYSVASIGSFAFSNCQKLQTLTIPASVTSIGDSAFSGCSGLASVAYKGVNDPGYGHSGIFDHCISLTLVCVPSNYISHTFCGMDNLSDLSKCGINNY